MPVAPPTARRRSPPRVAVMVALVGLSLLAWQPIAKWQQRRLAEQLAARAMASQSADHVRKIVDELWPMGLPATEPLARLAALQRPQVAAPAQQGLASQLQAWEIELEATGDAALFAAKAGALSALIAGYADQLDGPSQLWAKKLSRRMASDCDRLTAAEAWPILRACDRVASLETPVAPSRPAPAALASVANESTARPLTPKSAVRPPISPSVGAASPPTSPIASVSPDSGSSNLAVIPNQTSPSNLAIVPQRPIPPAARLPLSDNLSGPTGDQVGENPLRHDSTKEPAEGSVGGVPADDAGVVSQVNPLTTPREEPMDVPSPLDMRRLRQQLRSKSDAELMSLVETASRFEAAAARELLRTRGYTSELLKMTRELRQLPAHERLAALDRAGNLPAVEARRLLRWFVADEDADVRLQALSLLATTGDPQLAHIARERAVEDADPRVAELGAKLLQTR